MRWGKHWEQDWAKADVRQVQRDNHGREEHRNTGGKPNTGNTGEQKKSLGKQTKTGSGNVKHDAQGENVQNKTGHN